MIITEYSALRNYANIEITAIRVDDHSPVIGKSLIEIPFRRIFGVILVALLRKKALIDNPDPETIFERGDTVYIMGHSEQIANVTELFAKRSIQTDNFVET
jgi:CPA2 family monovalent cation:H+ antiporter-2